MKMYNINIEPPVGENLILYSKDNQWFVGTYKGSGQFSVVTECELLDSGNLLQKTNHIYKSYFVFWDFLNLEKDASEDALDDIVVLCNSPKEWEYPGQVVRDVAKALGMSIEEMSEKLKKS